MLRLVPPIDCTCVSVLSMSMSEMLKGLILYSSAPIGTPLVMNGTPVQATLVSDWYNEAFMFSIV